MAKIEYNFNGLESVIEFEYPALKAELTQIKPINKVVTSITGQQFVNHYANVELLNQTFTLLSREFVESVLRPFFRDHAVLGRPFKYFEDKTKDSYVTATLEKKDFMPKRHSRVLDRYDISFQLRIISETLPATNITDTDNTLIIDDNGQKSFFLIDDNGEKFLATYKEIA